jgi:peptidoglycan/xylan/chitin deacetylase (PgdA/CDA1 family)
MRWDRTISLTVATFGRGSSSVEAAGRAKPARRLPILMYHSIAAQDESRVNAYYRLCTSPAAFRQQMQVLQATGYRGLDLKSALAGWSDAASPGHNAAADQRVAAITFDDGFRNFYTDALPILEEFGFRATMYLPTAFIGEERRQFNGTDCLTWNEVRDAQRRGMHFGTHTVSHAKLYAMAWPQIESELRDSRAQLEDHLAAPVDAFAYPYAFPEADRSYCDRFCTLLKDAGYRSSVTTVVGRAAPGDDPLRLRRLPVNGADDPRLLEAKLSGAYDWLRWPQRAAKQWKQLLGRQRRQVA